MKQLVTYLPHVYPFSIVEMNEQKLVVLSNDNGRLRLYDPFTSIEYPYQSEPLYIIAAPGQCAGFVMERRIWLKRGSFSIAPDNCTSDQAIAKLAWYYVCNTAQPQFPTMRFSHVNYAWGPAFSEGKMGFMDNMHAIQKSQLVNFLWFIYAINHLGISGRMDSFHARNKFEKEFAEATSLVGSFSLPSHQVGSLQENSLIFYNGQVGYLTDYAAPPHRFLITRFAQAGAFLADPRATAYVLMTPSQCAHAVLEFGLTDSIERANVRSS